jgi:chemotaxis protein CheC
LSDFERFGDTQMDVLREVGNIGAGHAATALSKMLGKPVDMGVPRVNLVPFDEIAEQVGGPETVVVAVFLRVEGDAPGNLFFLLSEGSAKRLLKELVRMDSVEGAPFTELEVSALSEIGNILAGSYLSSLADFTQLSLSPTVPGFAVDMAGAILAYGLLQFGDMGDQALLIETAFFDGIDQVEGNLFLIPDPESFSTIFTSLGVPPE